MHPASAADSHRRNPEPAQRFQYPLTSLTEDAVPGRRAPAASRELAPTLLVQQRIDVPIGKPGSDRKGARHTVASPASESSGFAFAVVINSIHCCSLQTRSAIADSFKLKMLLWSLFLSKPLPRLRPRRILNAVPQSDGPRCFCAWCKGSTPLRVTITLRATIAESADDSGMCSRVPASAVHAA
jgi:hypothetical protein